jgi:hypothetical protein
LKEVAVKNNSRTSRIKYLNKKVAGLEKQLTKLDFDVLLVERNPYSKTTVELRFKKVVLESILPIGHGDLFARNIILHQEPAETVLVNTTNYAGYQPSFAEYPPKLSLEVDVYAT